MRRTEGRHIIVRAAAVCFLLVIAAGWIFFWRERQRQEDSLSRRITICAAEEISMGRSRNLRKRCRIF